MALMVILCSCGRNYVVKNSQVEEPGARAVGDESAEVAASPAAPGPAAETAPAPDPDLMEYTSVKGDTLAKVAAEHLGWDHLWRHLKEWNKRPEGARDPLPAGAKLVIPLRFRVLAGTRASATVAAELQPVRKPPAPKPKPDVRPPAEVLKVGEKLTYDVKWYALTAGQGTLTLGPMETVGADRCWHIIARATSKLIFFFKVDDRIESFCTADDLLPARFEKHLHEGGYRKDLVATFDRKTHGATWGQLQVPLGEDCRDLLGAFYYFRTMNLPQPGNEVNVCVHTDKTNFPMGVTILRRETVKVPAGEFHTILIKPRLKFEGLWRQRGDVLIWVTDDAARIPVLVQSKVHLLGSVNVVLTKIERPQ
ncbi:MAG: DUF3108 domain-containing protein [Candidatus Coatesbacteria bacterium]